MKIVFFIFMTATLGFGAPCMVNVNLSSARPTYQEGEPVELRLTFLNSGTADFTMPFRYPDLGGALVFEGARRAVSPADPWGQRIPMIVVSPNQSWSVSIFAQSFVAIEKTGPMKLPFRFALPCEGSETRTFQGQVEFEVVKGSGGDKQIAERIREGLNSTEFWRQRSASEAWLIWQGAESLSMVRTMLSMGNVDIVQQKFVRLRGNPEAARALEDVLRTGSNTERRGALSVAGEEKIKFGQEALDRAAREGDTRVKLQLLNYIMVVPQREYRKIVTDLVASTDAAVAREASDLLKTGLIQ